MNTEFKRLKLGSETRNEMQRDVIWCIRTLLGILRTICPVAPNTRAHARAFVRLDLYIISGEPKRYFSVDVMADSGCSPRIWIYGSDGYSYEPVENIPSVIDVQIIHDNLDGIIEAARRYAKNLGRGEEFESRLSALTYVLKDSTPATS